MDERCVTDTASFTLCGRPIDTVRWDYDLYIPNITNFGPTIYCYYCRKEYIKRCLLNTES
jgi:hypothetical protein